MRRLDDGRNDWSGSIPWKESSITLTACPDVAEETLIKVYQGKERSGEKFAQAERSQDLCGTKVPVLILLQRSRSGSSSRKPVVLKMEVPAARPRRKLLAPDAEGSCQIWTRGGLSTRTQGTAAHQPSLHLPYQAALLSHSSTARKEPDDVNAVMSQY